VADPKFRQVVPMRFFNLTLTSAEAAAYCADYLEEKSPRAESARILMRSVALIARITTELDELRRSENSPSLWKLHAGSLLALQQVAQTLATTGSRAIARVADEERTSDAESVKTSLQKLQDRCDLMVTALGERESETLQT
jgi:hypothetical protein